MLICRLNICCWRIEIHRFVLLYKVLGQIDFLTFKYQTVHHFVAIFAAHFAFNSNGWRFGTTASWSQRTWPSEQPCPLSEESTNHRLRLRRNCAAFEAKQGSQPTVYWIQRLRWWRCQAPVWSSRCNWRCTLAKLLLAIKTISCRLQHWVSTYFLPLTHLHILHQS